MFYVLGILLRLVAAVFALLLVGNIVSTPLEFIDIEAKFAGESFSLLGDDTPIRIEAHVGNIVTAAAAVYISFQAMRFLWRRGGLLMAITGETTDMVLEEAKTAQHMKKTERKNFERRRDGTREYFS